MMETFDSKDGKRSATIVKIGALSGGRNYPYLLTLTKRGRLRRSTREERAMTKKAAQQRAREWTG
jgi:hypothetical protein